MLASKVAQALSISSRTPLVARTLFATSRCDAADKKGTPAGEQGRDVRDMGTGKVNVPVGQPTKKADAPDSKFGEKAPGMAGSDQRGHDEVSGGLKTSTGKASAQQPGSATNYQPKRSFGSSSAFYAKDSGKDSSKGQQSSNQNITKDFQKSANKDHDAKNTFVSDSAKKNIDPPAGGSSSQAFQGNRDFYPEKPGFSFDPRGQQQGQQNQQSQQGWGDKSSSQQGQGGQKYGAQHNPSKTGKQQDSKYMDEALAGKSGPLVGGEEGRRKFSTSAVWAAGPKEPKDSGMGSGHSALMNETGTARPSQSKDSPDSTSGLKGTQRERTGDDASNKGKQKQMDINMGTVSGGESRPQGGRQQAPITGQPKRGLHTATALMTSWKTIENQARRAHTLASTKFDGKLKQFPHMLRTVDRKMVEHGLKPRHVETWGAADYGGIIRDLTTDPVDAGPYRLPRWHGKRRYWDPPQHQNPRSIPPT